VVDRRAHCGGGAKPARTCTVRAGGWPLHPPPRYGTHAHATPRARARL